MRHRKIRSITAITWLLVLALLVTWLGAMFCTTYLTAQTIFSYLYQESSDRYIRHWGSIANNNLMWETETRDIIYNIGYCNDADLSYAPGIGDWNLRRVKEIPLQIAVTVTDNQGNLLFESGDYLYFDAHTQQQWDAGEQPGKDSTFFYIPLERNELYAPLYELQDELGFYFGKGIMRITGYPDGEQFVPVTIDYASADDLETFCRTNLGYSEAFFSATSQHMSLHQYQDTLPWQTLLQKDAGDKTLSTIYTYRPQMTVFPGSAVTYQGKKYDSMLDLLWQGDVSSDLDGGISHESQLSKLLYFKQFYLTDTTDPDADGFTVDKIITCGVYANPLKAAIRSLVPEYLLTGLLMLAIGFVVWVTIRNRLILPLESACDAINRNWSQCWPVACWKEVDFLSDQINAETRHRRATQDKITQLETALRYAQTAETNRRQMTSNIAHELKTPLAIIHSYAEGLKEHIAEDKRDQYLDTILTESERMDAMVMEMLDLSRLEAGKVTLTRTEFSLSALTQAVYDTFSALAQEKQLQVEIDLHGPCTVLADEARIEQVLRNFLSNAIRYTPAGGTVRIRTLSRHGSKRNTVVFWAENTAPHFTPQQLEQLWETFYRADPARSSKGTGLGLAIAKNIISLHGGTCTAENTPLGVAFSFTI